MLRIQTFWTGLPGGPGVTNMFFGGDDGISEAEDAVLRVGAFFTYLAPAIRTGVTATVSGEVAVITPEDGDIVDMYSLTYTPAAGSNSTQPLPFNVQGLAQLTTGTFVGGRRIQGRFYLPGFCENDNESGIGPTSTLINGVSGALDTMADGAAALGVWSRRHGSFTPAVSVGLSERWATLRGRLR